VTLERPGQFDRFGERFGVAAVIFEHAEAGSQRQMFRPDFANGGQRFEKETAAIVKVASVLVVALVGMNRKKLWPR
jgi:hypothetical protein